MVVGLAIVAAGVAFLLDTLAVDVPWGILLPSAVLLVGLLLLLNPRSGSSGGWVTVGVIMTVVLLVSSLGGQPFAGGSADNIESADFVVNERVDRIIVRADAGMVEVRPGSGDIVEVERQLNFNDERPQVGFTVDEGVLEVEADCPGGFLSFGSSCSVDHLLRVPVSVEVEIDAGSGSARVAGLEGDVRVDTGSGVVELADLSGRVRAESGSGGVVLERLSGTTDVVTGSGGIRGSGLTSRRLVAATGSGSIILAFASSPDDLDLETGSGSVTITVPAGSYRLDLDTSAGSTDSPGISDDASSARTIRIRTGSGSIRVSGE